MEEAAHLTAPAPLYDDGSSVLQRELENLNLKYDFVNEDIKENFELEMISEIINKQSYKKISLQFPDNLLKYSDNVAGFLKEACSNSEIFILADTSYGSCCNDTVAASHIDSDLLIHFGHSCLSGIKDFPIIYSYGKTKFDTDDCIIKLKELIQQETIKSQELLLISELTFQYKLDEIADSLSLHLPEVKITPGLVPKTQNIVYEKYIDINDLDKKVDNGEYSRLAGRYFPIHSIPKDLLLKNDTINKEDDDSKSNVIRIVYLGGESLELTNILLNTQQKIEIYRYDPIERKALLDGVHINKHLMKRYVQVQKAKDATTFGVVVGTLGVANYLNMITHVQTLIKESGGKSYTFVMGKLNVAKLANFMEIDIFVLVACPENSLIDSKEFYKPIITPYELELALRPGLEWTGNYITEFNNVLQQQEHNLSNATEGQIHDQSDDDKPHYSLITGKFVQPRRYQRNETVHLELESSGALTNVNNETQVARILGSTAGEFLANRSFRGLEQQLGQTKVEKAQEGRKGIARGYMNEKNT